MARRIKARFSRGKIEPLEHLTLQEGQEIVISVEERTPSESTTRFRGKGFTPEDSLWKLAGIGQAETATDVSQDKHRYLAEAYSQKEE